MAGKTSLREPEITYQFHLRHRSLYVLSPYTH